MMLKDFGKTGVKVMPLGFGAMRLPMVNIGNEEFVELDKAVETIRHAIDSGINYFDTGLFYCAGESEVALGQALRGRRDKVILTTKATKMSMKNPGDLRRMLEHQMSKLDTDYLDFYCFHGIGWEIFHEADKATGWVKDMLQAKDEKLIRHIGFSFHDAPESIPKLVDLGLFEMITCQYNYLDRKNAAGLAYAREKGLATVVMGPLGGGRLTQVPPFVRDAADVTVESAVDLALRFVLSNPNVDVALSGMTTPQMVDENLAAVKKGLLTSDEQAKLNVLLEHTAGLADLYCTGCGYCMPCPQEVNIPARFSAMNTHKVYGLTQNAKENYSRITKNDGECTECGACETKCPQKIQIIKQLKETEAALRG
jgi:uncharacterized protein